jgi:hypothetical protein
MDVNRTLLTGDGNHVVPVGAFVKVDFDAFFVKQHGGFGRVIKGKFQVGIS